MHRSKHDPSSTNHLEGGKQGKEKTQIVSTLPHHYASFYRNLENFRIEYFRTKNFGLSFLWVWQTTKIKHMKILLTYKIKTHKILA